MVVEVIIGPGRKGKMVMRPGEAPEAVAKRFALEYRLSHDAVSLLRTLLEKQLTAMMNSSNC